MAGAERGDEVNLASPEAEDQPGALQASFLSSTHADLRDDRRERPPGKAFSFSGVLLP